MFQTLQFITLYRERQINYVPTLLLGSFLQWEINK